MPVGTGPARSRVDQTGSQRASTLAGSQPGYATWAWRQRYCAPLWVTTCPTAYEVYAAQVVPPAGGLTTGGADGVLGGVLGALYTARGVALLAGPPALAFAFAWFAGHTLPLLAVALAVPPKRSTSGLGIFVGIVMLVTYHKINQYAEQMGAQGRVDPIIALWVPFALFAALIVWMYWTLAHKPGGQPIGALERGFSKLGKGIGRVLRLPQRLRPGAA